MLEILGEDALIEGSGAESMESCKASERVLVLKSAAMSAAVVGRSSELSDLRMARLAHISDAGIILSTRILTENKRRTYKRSVSQTLQMVSGSCRGKKGGPLQKQGPRCFCRNHN